MSDRRILLFTSSIRVTNVGKLHKTISLKSQLSSIHGLIILSALTAKHEALHCGVQYTPTFLLFRTRMTKLSVSQYILL